MAVDIYWGLNRKILFTDLVYTTLCYQLAFLILPGRPDPSIIESIKVLGQKYTFRWRVPFDGGSSITFYTVYFWQVNTTEQEPTRVNTTEAFCTLNLAWNRTFKVAVTAWNEFGESPHSGNIKIVITPTGRVSFFSKSSCIILLCIIVSRTLPKPLKCATPKEAK